MDNGSLTLLHENTYAVRADDPRAVLSSIFGYTSFRGQQEEVIRCVMGGQSCCVLMPTGSGKSLCYQIPALCMDGVGVVISPLIALMQDQVIALQELGVRAFSLNSAQSREDNANAMRALRQGQADLIYVAPERLVMDGFLDVLDDVKIALFAVDEAHCISQWGHDFRPEYRQISLLRSRYSTVPCIAVTATADMMTRKDIAERLDLSEIFVAGFDRPNIHYDVSVKNNARAQFLQFLKNRPRYESGIVYCLSRRKVDETARWLVQQGYHALPYHAGLAMDERARNQNRFIREDGIIIVATIAFGMGINKPDVRFVAHLDLPKNIEAYYQETGRAGRDGLPATAWMVYGLQDVAMQRQRIEDSGNPEAQKRIERHKLNSFLGFCEAVSCRRQILLRYFNDDGAACGNCDTCLRPPQTMDGTVEAQKILSCIYRTGQMFGAGYVIDVLLGKANERMKNFGHHKVSTFGIGSEHDKKTWQSIVRQLVARGLIYVDIDNHSGLKLTAEAASFLKDSYPLYFRVERHGKKSSGTVQANDALVLLENEESRIMFEHLRTLRMRIAQEKGIPPYVVFHDKTLIDICVVQPRNMDELSRISGVGQSKLRKYGDAFLEAIASVG